MANEKVVSPVISDVYRGSEELYRLFTFPVVCKVSKRPATGVQPLMK